MSGKGRPNKKSLRINGNRANLMISLKEVTVVFNKLKDKFSHVKSTDNESKTIG